MRSGCFWLLLSGPCRGGDKPASTADKPKPVEQFKPLTNESDDTFKVGPFTPAGPTPPEDCKRIELNGDMGPESAPKVLLVPLGDTYLAQVTALLAALDDAGAEVWLKHPEGSIAFPVKLR